MKRLLIPIKILISAAILWYLFDKAQREGQFTQLLSGEKPWRWLIMALILCFGAHWLGFYRWHLIAKSLNLNMSMFDATKIGLLGQFFGLIAFGVVGGDSLRAIYAIRNSPGKKTSSVASVFFDRFIGLLTMFAFAGLGYWFNDWANLESSPSPKMIIALRSGCLILLWLSLFGLGGLVVVVFAPKALMLRAYEMTLGLPFVGSLLSRLIKVVMLFREKKSVIFISILLSIGINILFVISIFLVAKFVSGPHPTLTQHFVVAPVAMIANSVPLPGGLGGMEAVLDLQYQALSKSGPLNDATNDLGVVVGFLYRFLLLLISATGAAVWLTMTANERRILRNLDQPKTSPN